MNASTPFSELIPALLKAKQRTDAAMKAMKATATEMAESELAQKAITLYKAHSPNLSTYALIAAAITLTAVQATLTFILTHYSRRDEYAIIAKLAVTKGKRRAIQAVIAAERKRLNLVADFRAFADRTAKRRRIASASLRNFGVSVSRFLDAVFCLG